MHNPECSRTNCVERKVKELVWAFNKLGIQPRGSCPYCFGASRSDGNKFIFEHDDTCEWYIFTKALAAVEALYA